ncbi:MAG TPA: transcription termination/antitermination NusG family protein [Tepidisphaeraceae bacterium]|nr:transcription termination/antitermination NusG family protein [Tepidisphaeraceae bacterium]
MSILQEAALTAPTETWPDESIGAWFVLRTKARQEKILAQDLEARGIRHFLPLVTCTKFYGGRRARVELPLFPGYLFLRGDLDHAYTADRTHRIAQIIRVPDQHQIDRDLRNIHLALGADATLDPFPYLRSGVPVEVRDGPFRGLQGIVQDRSRLDRLILQVETLGQAVSLEIDASLLDLI